MSDTATIARPKRKTASAPLPTARYHLSAAPLTVSPPVIGTPKAKRRAMTPEAIRSRKSREALTKLKLSAAFSIRVKQRTLKNIVNLLATKNPAIRDGTLTDQQFKRTIEHAFTSIIETTYGK